LVSIVNYDSFLKLDFQTVTFVQFGFRIEIEEIFKILGLELKILIKIILDWIVIIFFN
jgi:hypothetical protein